MEASTQEAPNSRQSLWALGTAAVAALLASSCCLVPLVLVSVGFSGAWLSHLRIMQPWSPLLIVVATGALGLAWRGVFRAGGVRQPDGNPTERSRSQTLSKVIFWVVATLTGVLLLMPLVAPWQ